MDALDGVDQIGQAFQREVLALHRDDDAVGGGQSVERQQGQRRRAIDQHEIVLAGNGVQRGLQLAFALVHLHKIDLGAGQLAVGGQDVIAAGFRLHAGLLDGGLADQHLVQVRFQRILVDAATHRGVALRVQVHQQHALIVRGKARRQIDGGRRLAHTTLLVGDAEDAGGCAGG
ncbi:hypothetical protein G6F57_016170 [Rhizopus arrhizus]|nr:hypothetical protein G6F22_019337 [Rhizopus arrhizus]KAG1248833.1 hypothetical protein G6F68_013630 [Rhizopus microsporus]KAG1451393.1 hypothetical protein G6F57_016170 [Rhizopus arrhizus]